MHGTVLLVDDEEAVRSIGSQLLKTLGFTPITANDGLEALSIFKETPGIAFVILDLTMPRMDGREAFFQMKALDPEVRVVLTSGYSEQESSELPHGLQPAGFIQKPFSLQALRRVLEKALE